jgi:hypothetical protein
MLVKLYSTAPDSFKGRYSHKTLQMAPAMAADVCARLWPMEDIVDLIEAAAVPLPDMGDLVIG